MLRDRQLSARRGGDLTRQERPDIKRVLVRGKAVGLVEVVDAGEAAERVVPVADLALRVES